MNVNEVLFQDFKTFACGQLLTTDIDPAYPVLRHHFRTEGWSKERRIWATILYVTAYHLGSAYALWKFYPKPGKIDFLPHFRTGIERRGFRGEHGAALAQKHLNHICDWVHNSIYKDLVGWLEAHAGYGGITGWANVRRAFEQFPYCGPWASYKFADLVKHVLGYPIVAPDLGVGGGGATAGPIPGLVLLTGEPWDKCARDITLQKDFLDYCLNSGIPFAGFDQLETSLCDFNSLVNGRYYLGHDIDMMMEQIGEGQAQPLWEARISAIPQACRGEHNQRWFGVRKELKKMYKDTRAIYSDV